MLIKFKINFVIFLHSYARLGGPERRKKRHRTAFTSEQLLILE